MTRSSYPKIDEIATALFRDAVPRSTPPPERPPEKGLTMPEDDGRATAAVGALLVWKLIQHGGCQLPVGPARETVEKLMGGFTEIDRRRLEREAVEILRWLEDSLSLLDDDWEDADDRGIYPWEDREFPDDGRVETIRAAIEGATDLEIEYFTYSRNALTRRRVTPLEIDGGRMLRAICHWRRDERHFLLRRIKEVRPLGASETRGS